MNHIPEPSSQEMDIFEQQEMSKSWSKVRDKLKEWYNWLVSHVPKAIKERASRAFKTFKDMIVGCMRGLGVNMNLKKSKLKNPLSL